MKFVRYLSGGMPQLGLLSDGQVLNLAAAFASLRRQGGLTKMPEWVKNGDLDQMLQAGDDAVESVRAASAFIETDPAPMSRQKTRLFSPLTDLRLLPPIRRPGKLLCVGLNYPMPGSPSASSPAQYPVLFHKAATAMVGHGSPIVIPRFSQEVEYEGELVIVIGKTGRYISKSEALSFIAGYTIANDVGARDVQNRSSQWTSGKMIDTFCPIGPAMVTSDEVPDPNQLQIKTTVNGQLVQDGGTDQMIFDVSSLVSAISELCTLEPGDLILTGSPKNCGTQPDPRIFLKAGDLVSITIEPLGTLSSPVTAEEKHES